MYLCVFLKNFIKIILSIILICKGLVVIWSWKNKLTVNYIVLTFVHFNNFRFASSKSGKVYLHTDIRMIIFRKSDLDTATDHNTGKGYELRSFTRGPTNPKFSPRRWKQETKTSDLKTLLFECLIFNCHVERSHMFKKSTSSDV